MPASSSPRTRRTVAVAYRHALTLSAVVAATVVGIVVVDPPFERADAHASTLPPSSGSIGAHGPPVRRAWTATRAALADAERWAADQSAGGTRPDAVH